MNKLILFCLLSLMILYAQCDDADCTDHTSTAAKPCSSINLGDTKDCIDDKENKCKIAEIKTAKDCTDHTSSDENPCSSIYLGKTKECVDDTAKDNKCKSVDKPAKTETKSSNSSDILKISFALLIIFTIL